MKNSDSRTRLDRVGTWLLWLVFLAYCLYAVSEFHGGYVNARQGEMPLYTDYTPTYAASLLVREAPAEFLFIREPMVDATQRTTRVMYGDITDEQANSVGWAPWMYPPHFILLVAPLAYFPYWISYLLWLGVTAIPYVVAMRRILVSRVALAFALAAPPVFYNIFFGQTGFISAGCIGLGLSFVGTRPALAGIFIGLASVKPHLGLLIPIALIAAGRWREFGVATLTVVGTIALSVSVYGDDPWFAFIGTSIFHLSGFEAGAYDFRPMASVLSSLRMAGVSMDVAWGLQNAALATMAFLVGWAWWSGRMRADTLGLRAAILCLATPLAIPMVYVYDLMLIVPGVAWIWQDVLTRGGRRWELPLMFGALVGILLVLPVARTWGVQVGPLIVAALLGLAVYRYVIALRLPAPPRDRVNGPAAVAAES